MTASGNNDRVVVMPGIYLEPTARAKPTHDQSCDQYRTNGDKPGEEGNALSYAYQSNCPNDQNLVAVIGRAVGSGTTRSHRGRTATAFPTSAHASAATSRSRARE